MALKIGELFATLNLATGDFNKGLKGAQALFKKAGLAIADMGLGAAESMVEIGRSFESAMSDVQAISGATGDELRKLRDTAKQYGSTTAFTATESAQALKYMALAGWDANQSIEALPGVLDMAAASGMDLASASDAVTDYISAFGLEAKDATYMADAMAKAQATANTSAQQLAEAWGNSASAMHAAGQDMETTTAALMVFADQGLKGSEAGTALTAMMRDITQNMENGKIKIGKTSVAVADANGNFRDLNDIMTDVAAATAGMGDAEAQAALQATFTARSIQGVNKLLTAGIGQFNDYEAAIRGSAGTAAEQAEIMLDNLSGDIKLFQSALEGVQIDMYESADGILRDAVQGATDIVTAFQNAVNSGFTTDSLSEMLDAIGSLAENIGTRLFNGLNTAASSLLLLAPTILKQLTSMAKRAINGMKNALPKLVRPLIKVIPEALKSLGTIAPELADMLFSLAGEVIEQFVRSLPDLIPALLDGIVRLVPRILFGLGGLVSSLFKGINNLFGIGFDMEDVWDSIIEGADQDFVTGIKGQIDGEFEYEPAIAAAEEALAAVREAISGLGLDEATAAAIEDAVRTGSGMKLFEQTLLSMGSGAEAAAAASEMISTAMGKINGALAGLGLSDEAKEHIQNLISDGATKEEIQAAFESYGVDRTKADQIATEITTAQGNINAALQELGIDPATADMLTKGAASNKALIEASLKALGLPDTTIKEIMASYDTVASDISGRLSNVFQDIYDALTDGKDDTDDVVSALETEIRGIYSDAVEQINKWRDDELAKLDSSSATYETDSQAIIDKASEMTTQLGTQEQAALEFLTSMSGKSIEIVNQNKGTLDQILSDTKDTVAQFESLKPKQMSREENAFELVAGGYAKDADSIGRAIDFILTTKNAALLAADKAKTEAINELEKKGKELGEAEYQAVEDGIVSEWEGAQGNARAEATNRIIELLTGLANNTIPQDVLDPIKQNVADLNIAKNIAQWAEEAIKGNVGDIPNLTEEVMLTALQGIPHDVIAEAQERVGGGIENIFNDLASKGYVNYSIIAEYARGEISTVMDALVAEFKNLDKTEFQNAILAMLESGVFDGTEFAGMGADKIEELLTLVFSGPVALPAPELDVDESGTTEAANEASEQIAEVVDRALSEHTGGTSITTAVDPEVTVNQPTVTTGDGTGIQEAAEDYLEKQNLKIPVGAEVSLTVSVEDSNAAAVGEAAGAELGAALAAGIEASAEEVSTAAGGLANKAWAAISNSGVTAKAKSSGMYFATGFATGIRSGMNAVASAARAMANSAIEALAAAIQQGSPSKITMESGVFFGEGFGLGIMKELRFVREAAGTIADTAVATLSALRSPETAFAAQLSSAGGSVALRGTGGAGGLYGALERIAAQNRPQPIDYDRLADAMNERSVALYENGRERARIEARDNARASNNLQRRINLSVGK